MDNLQQLSAEIHDLLRSSKYHSQRLQHTSSATMNTIHKFLVSRNKGWRKGGAQVQPVDACKQIKPPPPTSQSANHELSDIPSSNHGDESELSSMLSEKGDSSSSEHHEDALQQQHASTETDATTITGTATCLTPSYTAPHIKQQQQRDEEEEKSSLSSTGTLTLLENPPAKSSWRLLHQHQGLRRAVTWIGQPLNKILRMGADAAALDVALNLDRFIVYDANKSHLQPSRSATYTARQLHCRVLQITNFTSSREYQYELAVQLNGEVIHTITGLTKKVTKGVSAASPQQTFTFMADGPFELNLVLMGRPVIPTSLADGIARVRNACSSNNHHHVPRQMPILGSKQLLSGDSLDAFVSQGICRYTLTPPLCASADHANMEVMLMFRLDHEESSEHHHQQSLYSNASLPLTATTTAMADDTASDAYSITLHDALEHCRRGDSLTFYVRGQGHPVWIRYWVRLHDRHMLLYNTSSQEKPVDTIPLEYMRFATRPTSDDQERVYMSSCCGIVLQFDRNSATFVEPARLDDSEVLGGKIYFYADSDAWAACWRHALALQAKPGVMLKKDYQRRDGRVNLRYMW